MTRTIYTDPQAVARRKALAKLSKATLAGMLVRGGTVYPPHSQILRWRHDELVMGVLRQEFRYLPDAVPAADSTPPARSED
jgi:hypothetical protein